MRKIKEHISLAFLWLLVKFNNLKLYQSIDTLPIYYWHKIHESGNPAFLIIAENIHIERQMPGFFKMHILSHAWAKIYDEMIGRFGFSEEFLEVFRKEKEIAIMKGQMIISGDMTKKTFIEIAEIELGTIRANIDKFSGKVTFEEAKAFVESRMGFRINPFECSVAEYYGYLMTMKKMQKKTG